MYIQRDHLGVKIVDPCIHLIDSYEALGLIDHKPIGMTQAHSAQQLHVWTTQWSHEHIGGMHATVECMPCVPAKK